MTLPAALAIACLEAEAALLGTAMFSPAALARVIRALPPDCLAQHDRKNREQEPLFSDFANQEIWQVIYDLAKAGRGVDMVTVASELDNRGRYQAIGGAAYLCSITEEMVTTVFIEEYARIVFEKWQSRQLSRLSGLLQDGELRRDPSERSRLLERMEQVKGLTFEPEDNALASHLADYISAFEQRRASGSDPGIRTGIERLDALTGGARPQELWIVGARTSMGKSCVLLQIAYQAARAGRGVWYLSLEMSRSEVMERLISLHSGVPLAALRDPRRIGHFDADRVHDANAYLAGFPIEIVDTVMDPEAAKHAAMRAVRQSGAELVIVDYLQIFRQPKGVKWDRYQMVTNSAQTMKHLAKDAGVPVICGAQVSRDIEKRQAKRRKRGDSMPRLSDLRESGAIEQDADVVVFLQRHGAEQPPRADLEEFPGESIFSLAKQRNGQTGWWPMLFDAERVTFRNVRHDGRKDLGA